MVDVHCRADHHRAVAHQRKEQVRRMLEILRELMQARGMWFGRAAAADRGEQLLLLDLSHVVLQRDGDMVCVAVHE